MQLERGYSSAFVRAIDRIATTDQYQQLWLILDPLPNPHAYAPYQRLRYQALQPEPYQKTWAWIKHSVKKHHGED